jgi:hypothetical protein
MRKRNNLLSFSFRSRSPTPLSPSSPSPTNEKSYRRNKKRFRRLVVVWGILAATVILLVICQHRFLLILFQTPHRQIFGINTNNDNNNNNNNNVTGIGDINRPIIGAVANNLFLAYRENNKHDANDADEDVYLSPFVAKLIQSDGDTNHNVPIPYRQQICAKDTTNLILEEWKQNHRQLTCDTILPAGVLATTTDDDGIPHALILVDEYILHRWENQPTVVRFKDVEAWSMSGPRRTRCRPIHNDATASLEFLEPPPKNALVETMEHNITTHDGNTATIIIDVNATVIRIVPFDVSNSYERFHAYVNVAMIMIMFDLRDPQLVFVSSKNEERDMEMWRILSKLEPIFVSDNIGTEVPALAPKTRYRFRYLIEAPSSDLSMINTKSTDFDVMNNKTFAGALRGRGADHHCKSLLFQAIVEWIKQRVDRLHQPKEPARSIDPEGPNRTIQILWSSRRSYCCRNGSVWTPRRIMGNETQWIESMGTLLGPGYNITTVDFGTLSTLESIRLVAQSDIMVGVHGAGLVWSVFLPLSLGKPGSNSSSNSNSANSGLIEIFGGDRNPTNRHYHNIASLVGIEYRETVFWKGSDTMLRWNEKRLHEVVSRIRSVEIS